MLVSMSASSLDEFYPAIAIASMMRIINEPSLSQFHLEAVSSINTIFKSLGIRSVQYIPQVVPACLKVMRENESVRQVRLPFPLRYVRITASNAHSSMFYGDSSCACSVL